MEGRSKSSFTNTKIESLPQREIFRGEQVPKDCALIYTCLYTRRVSGWFSFSGFWFPSSLEWVK